MWYLAVALVICAIKSLATEKTLPIFVKTCKANDPNLSKCFAESVEILRPFLTKDQPKLNFPSIDPLHLTEVALVKDDGSPNLRINSLVKNVEVTDGRYFQLKDAQVTLNPYRVHLRVRFPQLVFRGEYEARGKILLIEFDGQGKMYANFSDLDFAGSWAGKEYEKKGVKYVNMQPEDIDVKLGRVYIHLGNLFEGRPDLTENINQSINENMDVLAKDLFPELKKTIGSLITALVNRFHQTFPLDVLYPKD